MSGNLFCSRLRELRGDLSQEDFAQKIGTKQTTLSNWERGFREPNFSGLALISTSCEVSADWLLGLSDYRGGASGYGGDAEKAQMANKIRELEIKVATLENALSLVGGRRAPSAKTGGSTATKTA
ncbi:MAG: helix-turn-helix transcriptional regulator [Lentisphaerae bacterium]|nr:helix-turn-helix transcriptional regulator [Lentisphaerota bacterium]